MRKSTSVAYVFGSKLVTLTVSMVKGLLVPGYLGPHMYGILNLLGLIKTILSFSTIGFDTAYLRMRSSLIGEGGKEPEFVSLQNNVFSFLLLSSIIGSLICLVIPFVIPQEDGKLQQIMVFAFTVTAIQHFFYMMGGFYNITCVTQKRFKFISLLDIVQVTVNLVLLLATVFIFKIYGVFIAELISVLVVQAIYILRTNVKVKFEIRWEPFKQILLYSLPFSLTNISFYFARMIDKTIILMYLTFTDMGLYSFALNITVHSRLLYKSVAQVLSPYFIEEMGEKPDALHLSTIIKLHTLYVAATAAVISFNAVFLCDLLGIVLPKYEGSMIVLKILLINSYVSMVPIYQGFILGSPGVRKQNLMNIIMIIAGAINCVISILMIKLGHGILGVAVGTLISMFIWQGLVIWYAHKYYLSGPQQGYYLKLVIPVLILFLAVWCSDRYSLFEAGYSFYIYMAGNIILLLIYKEELHALFKIGRNMLIERRKRYV